MTDVIYIQLYMDLLALYLVRVVEKHCSPTSTYIQYSCWVQPSNNDDRRASYHLYCSVGCLATGYVLLAAVPWVAWPTSTAHVHVLVRTRATSGRSRISILGEANFPFFFFSFTHPLLLLRVTRPPCRWARKGRFFWSFFIGFPVIFLSRASGEKYSYA